MSDGNDRLRSIVITYFPMFIATLSLVTSIYNGYLNGKFVDLIQRNLGRAESMRTCKEIIDAYFQVKFRTGLLSAADLASAPTAQVEAANAVNKFAALGTYLANLRDEGTRERYTALSQQLDKIVDEARRMPPAEQGRLFENADRMFAGVNDDCVKSAQ